MSNILSPGGLIGTPTGLTCESKGHPITQPPPPATHIYGPECEAETGNLMYLCASCAAMIRDWMQKYPNRPVECPTHGNIGPVKSYVVLKALPKGGGAD